jgi:hypothetical protein
MKKILSFGFCILIFTALKSQTRSDVTLYAYARPVTGGAPPRISTKENNLQALPGREKYVYLIYLAGPAKTRIYPAEMYIHGERTGVKVSVVTQTPVEIKTGDIPEYSRTITLVPRTSKKVYRLDLAPAGPEKEKDFTETKAQSNELVVVYKYAGKFYYAAQKKITLLDPIVLQ